MIRKRTLAVGLAMVAALSCAGSARAETSIYVAEQPALSLVLKAEGGDVYATYLRARIVCRGAGSHWEERNVVTHRAFEDGPVKLRRSGGRLRLVSGRNGPFESSREIVEATMRGDRIVGSFSFFASGEGIGGSCESDAPEFEPEFGEREPPVPFEAQRYVPIGSPLAKVPDPAEEALYFAGSKSLEIYLWVGGGALNRVRGTAMMSCTTRKGKAPSRRRSLGFDPPYPLIPEGRDFNARAGLDYGFRTRFAHLTGTVEKEVVVGRLRILSSNRAHGRVTSRCRTGRRGGDGVVGYSALRYMPLTTRTGGEAG